MTCCVPGCTNRLHKWAIQFPRDEQLRARWKASIRAGTGQCLSDEIVQLSAPVCNIHFVEQPSDHDLDMYREPSLFKRKSVQCEVACCRLCLRYDSIDKMLDIDDCSVPGSSLNWLAGKHFWLFQLNNGQKGYFCNSCNVQVDMSGEFDQKIGDAATEYKKLLQKMANESMVLKSVKKEILETKESVRDQVSINRRTNPDSVGFPMCVIVKQEPNLSESDTHRHEEVTQVIKQEPISVNSDSSRMEGIADSEKEQIFVKEVHQSASTVSPEMAPLKITEVTGATQLAGSDGEEPQNQIQHKSKKKKQSKKKPIPTNAPLATRTGGKGRKYPMCLLCQTTFLHSKEIVTHFKQVHPETELKTFDCKDCDEVFFLTTSYHSHRKYHTNKFACDRCGKKHISRRGLVRHLYISHEVPFSEEHLLPCPICDKKVRDYNFTSHIRYHTKLGQSAENFDEKIGDVEKRYKKLLQKRLKEGVNIDPKSDHAVREDISETNDSENGESVGKNEPMHSGEKS